MAQQFKQLKFDECLKFRSSFKLGDNFRVKDICIENNKYIVTMQSDKGRRYKANLDFFRNLVISTGIPLDIECMHQIHKSQSVTPEYDSSILPTSGKFEVIGHLKIVDPVNSNSSELRPLLHHIHYNKHLTPDRDVPQIPKALLHSRVIEEQFYRRIMQALFYGVKDTAYYEREELMVRVPVFKLTYD